MIWTFRFIFGYRRGILSYWNGTRLPDVIVRTGDGFFFLFFFVVVCCFYFTTFASSPWICKTSLCIFSAYIHILLHLPVMSTMTSSLKSLPRDTWAEVIAGFGSIVFHTCVPDRREIEGGWRKNWTNLTRFGKLLAVCYSFRFKSVHNNKQREFQLFVFSWLRDRKKNSQLLGWEKKPQRSLILKKKPLIL